MGFSRTTTWKYIRTGIKALITAFQTDAPEPIIGYFFFRCPIQNDTMHRFPNINDSRAWDALSSQFSELCLFKGAVGAIDGSYIRIAPGMFVT